ncbi:3-isopropylmalate dehydrogenase [Nocardioides sp. LHG3406-4]|uniref:3-isopropylmalate dehydrogenase n=1 Tax=Nocardioides sp. LHG3406-4 TaxID=2804575 RepID=UPI003CF7C9B0
MSTRTIAVIAGDGIGPEVTDEALKVATAAARVDGVTLEPEAVDLGARRYLESGHVLDDEDLARLAKADAILLGALGDPRVPPGILERGVIVGIRRHFRQSVNVRPVKLLEGVASPLRDLTPDRCDMVIVRENTEGLYAGGSSAAQTGTPYATAVQTSVTTHAATRAAINYAFSLATSRRRHVTVCHKTNILVDAGRIWSSVSDSESAAFPDVEVDYAHVDAMTLHMVQRPDTFDVIVTDNLFGDILSDLGAAIAGGLGFAASANLNLDGAFPSMFEPVHGSAPDIAGSGRAHPAAAILSAGMMLDHLGLDAAAERCRTAVARASAELAAGGREVRTVDFGDAATSFVS